MNKAKRVNMNTRDHRALMLAVALTLLGTTLTLTIAAPAGAAPTQAARPL